MKRLSLSFFLVFILLTALSGCLSGPGVEPPNLEDEQAKDQPSAGGAAAMADQETPGSGGSGLQATGGIGVPTAATGGTTGAGGAGGMRMDAGVADGGTSFDSGAPVDSAIRDVEDEDDAGSEQ